MDLAFVIWIAGGLLFAVLLTAAGYYAFIRFVLSGIDIISEKTSDRVRQYDPAFDPDAFRGMIRPILEQQDYLMDTGVIFHDFPHTGRENIRKLNANTALPGVRLIIFTPGWAAVLSKCMRSRSCRKSDPGEKEPAVSCSVGRTSGLDEGAERILDFFIFTLGHEMTHKEGQYRPLFAVGRRRQFAAWVREIQADMESLHKTGLTPERAEMCIRNRVRDGMDVSRGFHPSWEYRISMMKRKCFDGAVIDRIAGDLGMHDRRFCRKVKKFYCGGGHRSHA